MKQFGFTLSLLLLVLFSVSAQNNIPFQPSYIVKWAPSSLYTGKIGLGSEWNFQSRRSVTFNIGIPSSTNLTRNIDNKDRTLNWKTFSVMGGYRMYMSKRRMTGFYFEPYIKYVDNKSTSSTNFTIQGTDQPFNLNTTYSGLGIGAQLGLQFIIAKKVVFDWYILGPEANTSKFNLYAIESGSGPAWDNSAANDAQQEIQNFINDIPLIKDKATVGVNSATKTVHAAYSGFLPGVRTGLSIGIRF